MKKKWNEMKKRKKRWDEKKKTWIDGMKQMELDGKR